ncbi:hypothetical protein [Carboxylicivirga sp. N1Y90]|uniref:hypothetical protein n=1 Tax=Carboxylicivirga fragile TaxID=3417571 RepID=UPI003D3496B4|nr:hypothetical protein [Marinilabiliaceae bacterium N1Y90]
MSEKEEKDRYFIYNELNFGVLKLTPGKKGLNEISEVLQAILDDDDTRLIHFMLIDIRNCKFTFKLKETFRFLDLIGKYRHLNNRKRIAYLVNSPIETAFAHFFIKQLEGQRRVCSTMEKAYEHLNLNVSFQEFNKLSDI